MNSQHAQAGSITPGKDCSPLLPPPSQATYDWAEAGGRDWWAAGRAPWGHPSCPLRALPLKTCCSLCGLASRGQGAIGRQTVGSQIQAGSCNDSSPSGVLLPWADNGLETTSGRDSYHAAGTAVSGEPAPPPASSSQAGMGGTAGSRRRADACQWRELSRRPYSELPPPSALCNHFQTGRRRARQGRRRASDMGRRQT